jgi:hypothetical protein
MIDSHSAIAFDFWKVIGQVIFSNSKSPNGPDGVVRICTWGVDILSQGSELRVYPTSKGCYAWINSDNPRQRYDTPL